MLEQWTYLDKDGKPIIGNYYTLPRAEPNKLGIPLENRVKTNIVLNEDTKLLKSTTSDIKDWPPGSNKELKEGETQLFQTGVKYEIKNKIAIMITQISINDIQEIAKEIEKINYDCNELSHLFSGEIKQQKVSDFHNKIIIERVSDKINTVVIDCTENKIRSIAFYGSMNIQVDETFNFFKDYREQYSIHDDLYFYFFNEEKIVGTYIVSFFTSSSKKNGKLESKEQLSNLILSWG